MSMCWEVLDPLKNEQSRQPFYTRWKFQHFFSTCYMFTRSSVWQYVNTSKQMSVRTTCLIIWTKGHYHAQVSVMIKKKFVRCFSNDVAWLLAEVKDIKCLEKRVVNMMTQSSVLQSCKDEGRCSFPWAEKKEREHWTQDFFAVQRISWPSLAAVVKAAVTTRWLELLNEEEFCNVLGSRCGHSPRWSCFTYGPVRRFQEK